MKTNNYLFTSESVSEGHPDKVCDRISDMVVDAYISKDPYARVACETLTTTNKVILAGEIRGPEIKKNELIEKVRDCIKDIGYDQKGFSWKEQTKIESHLHAQSADIAIGVDAKGNKDEGAGDQGAGAHGHASRVAWSGWSRRCSRRPPRRRRRGGRHGWRRRRRARIDQGRAAILRGHCSY